MSWKRTFTALTAVFSFLLVATPASAATPVRAIPKVPPGYDQQRQQAQQDLARNQAELAAVQREETDLDLQIGQAQDRVRVERDRAAALARLLYVQPSSLLVMVAREPTPLASLQDALDLQFVAAHARDETQRIDELQGRIRDLRKERAQAVEREALIRQSLQVSLIQTAGIDVWGRARAWEQANPDWKVDPPNANHSKSVLAPPLAAFTLTQPYGPTIYWFEPPYNGYAHFHTGLDMSAPYGTPVQAADDGVVIATGSDGYGYGNYIVLGHPHAHATLYGHLSAITVHTGDKITQGQQIGLVGSTGNSTGPHLHFEVLVDGLPVDPAPFLAPPSGS